MMPRGQLTNPNQFSVFDTNACVCNNDQVRGGDALSTTVASTKETVRKLQPRGLRSRGGCIDFGTLDGRDAETQEELPCCTCNQERRTAGQKPPLSINGFGRYGGANRQFHGGNTAATDNDSWAKLSVPHDTVGRCKACARPTSDTLGRVGLEAVLPGPSEGPVVSETNCRQPCTGPESRRVLGPNDTHPQLHPVRAGDLDAKTASTTFARFLARLPLSKIKIVIGESAFLCTSSINYLVFLVAITSCCVARGLLYNRLQDCILKKQIDWRVAS